MPTAMAEGVVEHRTIPYRVQILDEMPIRDVSPIRLSERWCLTAPPRVDQDLKRVRIWILHQIQLVSDLKWSNASCQPMVTMRHLHEIRSDRGMSHELAPKDCFQIFSQIGKIFAGRKEWAKAAQYAEKAVEGLDTAGKPGQMSDSEWKSYLDTERATAFTVLGRSAAERKSWNDAISNYQKVINLSTNPAAKAEAYYYTGMGRWDQKQMDTAMKAFAKGSVQKDAPHAEHCRQYLETLYKSTHNDSLAGIDEFIARVSGG